MAARQLAWGAHGLTVAKAGEAEVMSHVAKDLLVAYPAVGLNRLQRLARLAKDHRLTLTVDSVPAAENAEREASRVDCRFHLLIDLDVGFGRTGVGTVAEALALAEYCRQQPHLHLDGLMCFPGHLAFHAASHEWEAYTDRVGCIVERFRKEGFATEVVSGGSTPTANHSHQNPWLTEIRPGTYIYNDRNEIAMGFATLEDCAARVVATVVSHSGSHKLVVDAGSKMLSSDRCGPLPDSGYGLVVELPDAKIVRLSEEHGEIELASTQPRPPIGSTLSIIPNHICPCVNLQDHFYLWQNDDFLKKTVDARGAVV